MNPRHKLLSAALAAALLATMPAFAQDSGTGTEAGVPEARLVDRYTGLAGSEAAAEAIVGDLRTGGDFTVTTTETRPVLNADGTQATNPDGTPKTETVTVETSITNPAGPMGWGEVNNTLAIAQKLVDDGLAGSLEEALTGTADVTNADGTVTAGTDGILQMRADGMGWGQIAKELGFNLGSVVGKGKSGADVSAGASASKSDRSDKAGRTAKPERVAKVDRPNRPERVERPAKPERAERPQKPERSGRP